MPARRSRSTGRNPAHTAVFPGSFDPVTYGHLDVIARGRRLFDRVVVGVGRNPGKDPLFSLDERVEMLDDLVRDMLKRDPDGGDVTIEIFTGLTVDFARSVSATALLRGIRNLSDLQSEVQQALTNRQVGGLETVFVVAGQDFAYTSSSLIRQVTALGQPAMLRTMVPADVVKKLERKKRERHPVLMKIVEQDGE